MAKLKTKNEVNTSVIEITDDEDSRSPVKNSASLNNDEYRIGANIADHVCLSSTDMDLLDSSLNAKQEYVKAMQKLSQNLQQIESVRTPISTAKLPTSKSTGKFKFAKPKSAAAEAFPSTPNTSIISSTIISTKNNVKPATIPAMFKTALSQSGTEKRKQPTDDVASSKKVEECSPNRKNNGTIKTDDDDYSFSRK